MNRNRSKGGANKRKFSKVEMKDKLKNSGVSYEEASRLDPTVLAAIEQSVADEESEDSTYESGNEDSITDENWQPNTVAHIVNIVKCSEKSDTFMVILDSGATVTINGDR